MLEEKKKIQRWLDLLEKKDNDFYKQREELIEEWNFLKERGRLRERKKLKEIDRKIGEYYIKRDRIKSWRKNILQISELAKKMSVYSFTDIDYILTKESYSNILKTTQRAYEKARGVFENVGLICNQIYELLKTDGIIDREQEDDINAKLKNFLEKGKEIDEDIIYNIEYEQLEVEFTNLVDSKLALNVLEEYYSLADIFYDSIKKGYDYETYYELVYTFLQIKEFYRQERELFRSSRPEERKKQEDLKNNAVYVISRNLYKNDVISLYERKYLLEYRKSILEEMIESQENWDTEEQNEFSLKLQRINQVIIEKIDSKESDKDV